MGTFLGDALTMGNVFRSVWTMISNNLWPRLLGGTPREWIFVDADDGAKESMLRVGERAEEGQIHVQIDSVFHMENALAVSYPMPRISTQWHS